MMLPTCGSSWVPRFQGSGRLMFGMPKHFATTCRPVAVTSKRIRYIRPQASPVRGMIPNGCKSFQNVTVFMHGPPSSVSLMGQDREEESNRDQLEEPGGLLIGIGALASELDLASQPGQGIDQGED